MFHSKSFLMAAMMLACLSNPVVAQDISIQNAESAEMAQDTTHTPLRLTPDKSQLVRLSHPAASVIVGNPAHINVLADNADTLVVVPRVPGASHFTVLDEQGEIIMQRHVIVASPQKGYVRVRRTCTNGDAGCQDTSVYYCPGLCHEIAMADPESRASNSRAQGDETPTTASNAQIVQGTPPSADSP